MRVKNPMGVELFEVEKKIVGILNSSGFTKELVFKQNRTLKFFAASRGCRYKNCFSTIDGLPMSFHMTKSNIWGQNSYGFRAL